MEWGLEGSRVWDKLDSGELGGTEKGALSVGVYLLGLKGNGMSASRARPWGRGRGGHLGGT